jgi:hypothetical protein
MSDNVNDLITAYRRIILGDQKSWVLFKNGTCVILMQPGDNLRQQAIELLRQWGPVHVGSPAADFSVIHLSDYPGWIVTGHHPDVLNYVAPDDVETADDLFIGLFGRSVRGADGHELEVVYIEDRRSTE